MKAPERWLDRPDALPDELLAGMQAYASTGVSERELAQLRVGLRLKTRGAPSLALKALKWLAALATVGGIAWLAWPAPPPPQRAPAAPPVTTPVVVAPSPELAPSPKLAPSEAAPPPPVRPKRVARASVPPPAIPEPAAPQDPAAELALLQRARRALAATPATALALTDEHLRSFPRGTFAEERELIAIEALAPQDRSAAQERARQFASKYPHSVHQARIETLLGAR